MLWIEAQLHLAVAKIAVQFRGRVMRGTAIVPDRRVVEPAGEQALKIPRRRGGSESGECGLVAHQFTIVARLFFSLTIHGVIRYIE
jgi:hypothetical protein